MDFIISKKLFDTLTIYETKNYKIYSFLNFKKIKFRRICVINIVDNYFMFLHSIRFDFFMDDACFSNNLSALEWFKKTGYELKYNFYVFTNACMNENIEILKWFKQNNYLKNIKTHTDTAIEYGKIKCLDWFKSIGFKIKYNYSALIDAYNYNRRVDIFSKNNFYLFYAWLKKNNYKHKNYKKIIKICKCKYIEFKTKNKYLKGYNKN